MSRNVRQKGITDWKPPFQSSIAEVASNNPISSVVSLGIVPAVGALAGKVGNLISAAVTPDDRSLERRVADNVAPVMRNVGRVQDVQSTVDSIPRTPAQQTVPKGYPRKRSTWPPSPARNVPHTSHSSS